jgi:hypothetical protein
LLWVDMLATRRWLYLGSWGSLITSCFSVLDFLVEIFQHQIGQLLRRGFRIEEPLLPARLALLEAVIKLDEGFPDLRANALFRAFAALRHAC